ncbi:DUF4192 domain-containing protein [Streptomyces galbus]|uniref:DUF4192 domain-containing protein n=1 Tax=Streptomyces galbus TaxID=33898 RepID=UPI0019C0F20C|nr:DUF4192 domain-containing protein [Streptomyces galbus]GHD50404.1 hypothetical protein GCM10010335_61090 [Streptomyces galbus]
MTNHDEITGSFDNDDPRGAAGEAGPVEWAAGRGGSVGAPGSSAATGPAELGSAGEAVPRDSPTPPAPDDVSYQGGPAYAPHGRTTYDGDLGVHQVTLRTPAELADALPYLLGYRPEDSIILVSLHDRGGRGRFGGRARLGIPTSSDDWAAVAQQLAHGLVTGSERRGARPEQIVAYLCQEPAKGETGRSVMERLQPLAHQLRVACGRLDVPVIEALCISDGRFWSYCCGGQGCCPDEGEPMGLPGTSVLAAAAAYAGIQVRGTLRELRARLMPLETAVAVEQEIALDTAGMSLVPRIFDENGRAEVADETIELAERLMQRLAATAPVPTSAAADRHDDDLLRADEAAALILGLQDRTTRDRAAEWMEGDEAGPALRLWRALARRCVGPYAEHAAAPLTLAGWVAWSTGDELEAREALAMALGADPDYLFARLLHQACNEGLNPESVRRCLRAERGGRTAGPGRAERGGAAGDAPDVTTPSAHSANPAALGPGSLSPHVPEQRHRRRTRSGTSPLTATDQGEVSSPSGRRSRTSASDSTRPGLPGRGSTGPRTPGKPTASRRRADRVEAQEVNAVRGDGGTPEGDSATGDELR